jgi:hypothetical protein
MLCRDVLSLARRANDEFATEKNEGTSKFGH